MDAEAARRRRHRRERIVAVAFVLIAIVVTAVLVLRNWGEPEVTEEQKTYIPKPFVMTDDTRLLEAYLKIDTSNPPGRETAGARWLIEQFNAAGFRAELIEPQPGRGSVYARIPGKRRGGGLLLLSHIDVVPADAKAWKRPPFGGQVFLDSLYGRGAIDMKGTTICQLRAFLNVARSGKQPEHDLVFLAVADEERGGTWGTRWLLDHRPDIFEGVEFALNEGGITEVIKESLTYFGIEIGTKQSVTVILRSPRRESLQQARIALEPFYGSDKPTRILPEVRRFFSELAPLRIEYRKELEDVDRAVAEGRFWKLPLGYRELTQDVIITEAIREEGGQFAMNVILCSLPDTKPGTRIEFLRDKVRPFKVTMDVQSSEGPTPFSRIDTPLYRILVSEASTRWPAARTGTEILNRTSNDSRFLRGRGIVAYGVQAFPVDYFQSESIHAVDERVRIEWFNQGVALTSRVVDRYAFGM
jgi:acetylornithine deacetylase/succinyl-diaminopimelate desuccinylase-like protein